MQVEERVRQAREELKMLQKCFDRYGIALMLIREGAAVPAKVAAEALAEVAKERIA